jgi:hypothetical protein
LAADWRIYWRALCWTPLRPQGFAALAGMYYI